MSDTPRTTAVWRKFFQFGNRNLCEISLHRHACDLERELNASQLMSSAGSVSNTPRTNAVMDTLSLPLSWDALTLAEHARQLERELNAARAEYFRATGFHLGSPQDSTEAKIANTQLTPNSTRT